MNEDVHDLVNNLFNQMQEKAPTSDIAELWETVKKQQEKINYLTQKLSDLSVATRPIIYMYEQMITKTLEATRMQERRDTEQEFVNRAYIRSVGGQP